MRDKIKTIHVTPAPEALLVFLRSRLKILDSNNFKNIGYCYYNSSLDEFKKSGYDVIISNYLSRRFSCLDDLKFFLESYQIFKKEKPTIVNTYGPKPGLYARISARLAGVPIVVHTFWGFLFPDDFPWYKKIPFILLEKMAAYFCDYILSVNRDDLRIMQKYHFRNNNDLNYLGNGTDIYQKFNPRSYDKEKIVSEKIKLGLKPQSLVIGQIGRLTKSKGYKEFFEAAKKIKHKYPTVEFIVVGPFDNTKGQGINASEIEQLENEGIIKYLGSKNHDEMPLLYAMTDIIVLMSHREGFPRCLVEAAAMAKPLIATDIRGCREAVESGYNGFLVPIKDYQALTDALDKLINDPELRTKLGRNSRQKAERDFDEEKLVNTIVITYNRLLEEKGLKVNGSQDDRNE
jgi:glycosyltransferase involved in cell wall biosynthesis